MPIRQCVTDLLMLLTTLGMGCGGSSNKSVTETAPSGLTEPGTRSRTESQGKPRDQQTATMLPDDRVLTAGGFGSGLGSLSSSELFH